LYKLLFKRFQNSFLKPNVFSIMEVWGHFFSGTHIVVFIIEDILLPLVS